jgi:hypothetical protein
VNDDEIEATRVEAPALLPLLLPSLLPSNVLACNGCGSLVLNNPNAKSMHLDWHRS